MFYSKSIDNDKGFCTQCWKVALCYAMDRNIKEKKVVCDVQKAGELILSYLWWCYNLFWRLLCEITFHIDLVRRLKVKFLGWGVGWGGDQYNGWVALRFNTWIIFGLYTILSKGHAAQWKLIQSLKKMIWMCSTMGFKTFVAFVTNFQSFTILFFFSSSLNCTCGHMLMVTCGSIFTKLE